MPSDHRANGRPRDGRGKYTRSVDTAQRDAQAAALRARGESYPAIAAALGMNGREAARRAVERALVATVAEPAEELRQFELMRLDALTARAWSILTGDHLLIQRGETVKHPVTGELLVDPGPTLAAIDRLIRLSERRCKLMGLDAPTKILTVDQVDEEIARLSRELGITPGGDHQ